MIDKIFQGEALKVLKTFSDESVNCCVTSPPYWALLTIIYMYDTIRYMRNEKGQFKKGYTWRKKKQYWNKEWLYNQYINLKKSAEEIAIDQNCKKNNIYYFLQKFDIKTRTIKEIRHGKYWGLSGSKNAMYGKTGKSNTNWKGGHSPEKQ